MQNNQNEPVIYLKDLLFSALYNWKRILLLGLILALVLGGFKGYSAYRTISSDAEIPQVSQAPEQAILKKRLATLQDTLASTTKYQEESILMQIDPTGFYRVTLSVYVSVDRLIVPDEAYQPTDPTGAILSAYATVASKDAAVQILSEALDIKLEYMQDLINTSYDSNSGILTVVIPYPTQEGAQTIMNILETLLMENQQYVAQVVAPHQMSIYQKNVIFITNGSLGVVGNLSSIQSKNIQTILDLRTSINTTKESLNEIATNPPDIVSVNSLVRNAIIFAVVGMILGVFLAVAYICIRHICSDKVYSIRTLHNRTGVKVFGGINVHPKQGALMRKLRALDGRSLVERQAQCQLLAANVRNLCVGYSHLLVTGTAQCSEFTEALQKAMPGVKISVCGSLLQDVAAVDGLSQCDCVVLLEQCEISHYTHIQQSAAIIQDNKKPLLGCVLLNG